MRNLGSIRIISLLAFVLTLAMLTATVERSQARVISSHSIQETEDLLEGESQESDHIVARILNIDPESPPDLVVFLGRFHPLVVHLPISFILLALLIEILSNIQRFTELKPAISFILLLGFLSSIVAVIAGLLLSIGGDYGGDTLFWHQWLGIGVMITAGLAYYFKKRTLSSATVQSRRIYGALLSVSCLFLIMGSHYGGSLTHGTDYLTSYTPEPVRTWLGIPPRDNNSDQIVLTNIDQAHVYDDLISPILESKCTSCHNENKKRGDLILTNEAAILNGGENGIIIEAGSSGSSELTRRLRLDPDHEDHMPPDGRRPLPEDHIRILEWWVEQGASFDQSVGQIEVTEDIQLIFDRMSEEAEEAALAQAIPPGDPEAVASIAELGVLIQPLSQETNFLQAQFLNAIDSFTDKDLELLLPLSEQIIWLDLGSSNISDEGLETISQLTNLKKLHLEKTGITDDGLSHLANLEKLEYLNLYGTSITDSGLSHLKNLSNLSSLYLWQTNVSTQGVSELQESIPELYINIGWEESDYSD